MPKFLLTLLVGLSVFGIAFAAEIAVEMDLLILAGQSNAQGYKSDAAHYPQEGRDLDKGIPFYWNAPRDSSSEGKWTSLSAQAGLFPSGHFGPEITLARRYRGEIGPVAVFKYTQGSTGLASHWKRPGQRGMTDAMFTELQQAIRLLEARNIRLRHIVFIWIQGESDGRNPAIAGAYEESLSSLLTHLRVEVLKRPDMPVLLGVDEQHPAMKQFPQVVEAQQALARRDPHIRFVSLIGLEKADATHLTPAGTAAQGHRIFETLPPLLP